MSNTTSSSDLVLASEILEPAIAGAFTGMIALLGTGAAVINPTMPASVQGGQTIKVPYFGSLGEFDDAVGELDAITPRKLSVTSETASVVRAGMGFEQTMFSKLVEDPRSDAYAEASRQIAKAGERYVDGKLISAATASLTSSMVKDVYSATVPRTIDYDVVTDAKMLWGDEQMDIAAMVVHSKVLGDMMKLKDGIGRPLLTMPSDGSIARFVGMPVVVSDRLTASTDSPAKYTSLLLKRNALVFWHTGKPSVRIAQDAAADTDLVFVHLYSVAYRYLRLPGLVRGGVVQIKTN